ncbi:hypothetical protein [Flavobacterium ginsengiterrae]|uniref:Uncharacterized protein n=1 Tax=Flavobacterium ginsengiterrae TaxID=871695 RepID=A0ABP7GLC7_9FLAO
MLFISLRLTNEENYCNNRFFYNNDYKISIVYDLIISVGSQKIQTKQVPEELKELKTDLENDKIEVIFYEIPEIDLEKCHAKQEMERDTINIHLLKSKNTMFFLM